MHWPYQKFGVWRFHGENWNMYLSEPRKAHPYAKTHVLTYYSPKSVHNCDLWRCSRNKTKQKTDTKDVNVVVCWRSRGLADFNAIWQSYRCNEVCKISSASVTSFLKYRGSKLTTLGFTVHVPYNNTLDYRLWLWFLDFLWKFIEMEILPSINFA